MNDQHLSEDALLGGKVRLFQPREGYRVAVDPIFLAAAVPAKPGEQILDVGAGSGAAMLCLAARVQECRLLGIELQRELLRIANKNLEANDLTQRAEMIAGDLGRLPPRLMAASFDHVMTNPPFMAQDAATPPPLRQRAEAYVEGTLELGEWLKKCLLMLKNDGQLTVIHRADRLGEVLSAIDGKVGDTVIYPLWPKADGRPAKRILVQGRKGARGPLKLARGLVVHQDDGRYTQAAAAILRNGSAMPLRPPKQDASGAGQAHRGQRQHGQKRPAPADSSKRDRPHYKDPQRHA